jgi:predicted ATPase/class 3 adenylate cyclase
VISCPQCATLNAEGARFCSDCGSALARTSPPSDVRKTVTVMFLDVVGSTGIGERTDPESLRRVMTRYFDEIRTIVERHGGIVEKFIGDAVMAVFGVPTVHEDDALRAVRSAVEIRGRLVELERELQRDRGLTVSWRTGINTGEVVAGDAGAGQRFVTGDAVNIAARLEQAAQPTEILIGAETQRLVRDAATVERAEPVAAKGKTEPVEAYRLIDVVAGAAGHSRRLDAPMIGRRRQRTLLEQAYEQVVEERVCHLVTVLGAAGVGKSRLVREFLDGVGDAAMVLRGRCLSYGEGITYWPIAQLVRQAADLSDDDDDQTFRHKIGALLDDERDRTQVAERLGELLGRFEGGGAQEETFWAVRTLVESLARQRPLVIVLDDLHWAEPTLLDLVENLCDWTREAPVMVVCLARHELLDRRPGWGGGKSYATTLTLEPLSNSESHELVMSLLGQVTLSSSLADRISDTAEGNPLFVEEMLGMLVDSGQLVPQDGGWVVAGDVSRISVPPTIHALLAARLDGLPPPERAVLERGSVEGKVFHGSAVAELAPDSIRQSVPDHLRSLARKELLRPQRSDLTGDDAFRFRHLLIRDAAYTAMAKETRAELHAKFAGWLSRVAADHIAEYEEILGYHYEQAFRYRRELGPLDLETQRIGSLAALHLGASGQRALDREDSQAGRKLLASAIELTAPDDPYRTRLQAELGLALHQTGDLRAADALLAETIDRALAAGDTLGGAHAEVVRFNTLGAMGQLNIEQVINRAEELVRLFEEHDDQRGAVRATLVLAEHHFYAGRAAIAEATLSRAIDAYPPSQAPFMLLRWTPTLLCVGPTPVKDATRRIEAILGSAKSRAVEGEALMALGALRAAVGQFDEGRQVMRRAVGQLRDLGLRRAEWTLAGNFLGDLEFMAGRYDAAEAVMLDAYVNLRDAGDLGYSSTIAGMLAHLYVAQERFAEAERYARIGRETATDDDVDAQSRALAASARVLAARGELEAAELSAREGVTLAERTDYLQLRGEILLDLAEVLIAGGRRREAAEVLSRAAHNFDAKGATFQADRVRRRLDAFEAG